MSRYLKPDELKSARALHWAMKERWPEVEADADVQLRLTPEQYRLMIRVLAVALLAEAR